MRRPAGQPRRVPPRSTSCRFPPRRAHSLWHDTKQAADLAAAASLRQLGRGSSRRVQAGASTRVPCRSGPREETFDAYPPAPRTPRACQTLRAERRRRNLHNVNEIYAGTCAAGAGAAAVVVPAVRARAVAGLRLPPGQRQPECLDGRRRGCARARELYLHDPPLGYSYGTDLAKRYNRITARPGPYRGVELRRRPGRRRPTPTRSTPVSVATASTTTHVRLLGMTAGRRAVLREPARPRQLDVHVSPHTATRPDWPTCATRRGSSPTARPFLELDSDLPSYDVSTPDLSALGYQYLHMVWNGRGHDFNLLNDAYALVEPWTSAATDPSCAHHLRHRAQGPPARRAPLPGASTGRGASRSRIPSVPGRSTSRPGRADRLPLRENPLRTASSSTPARATTSSTAASPTTRPAPSGPHARRRGHGLVVRSPCSFDVNALRRPASANAIAGSLDNVASLTVDARRMGIDTARPVCLDALHTPDARDAARALTAGQPHRQASARPLRARLVRGRSLTTVTRQRSLPGSTGNSRREPSCPRPGSC